MTDTVVILGAGAPNGLGGALARRFSREGLHVILSGRTLAKVEETASQVNAGGGSCEAMQVDVISASDQDALFAAATAKGKIAAVLYNAGNNAVIPFEELSAEQFEHFWRVGCFGAFLTAQRAMPLMREQGEGSIIFTGATGSIRGAPNFAHFASSKAALRNLVQALARDYGPKGVHVAHIIIDGVINGQRAKDGFREYLDSLGPDGTLEPDDIAETFWAVHSQPRSTWTHELDLRPFKEKW
ncbi:MAG: SDR family NAD(P)-dependent oxidoreductase [Pseudomonadota bacterium]